MLYDYTATTTDSIDQIATDAIATAEALVAEAIASTPPTWAGTIGPLEQAGTVMGDAYGRSPFTTRFDTHLAYKRMLTPTSRG